MVAMADTEIQLWLQQLRDEPVRTHKSSLDPQPSFTVFRVPDILRTLSPAYHERKELQLGLHNRTLQTNGTQLVKIDIARSLHARLVTTGGSWEAFATTVVGDSQTARGHYQLGTNDISDELVPYLLALDALFLVVFFEFLNGKSFLLPVFEHLEPQLADVGRILVKSDLLLLENQIPMYLLKNVIEQLVIVRADPGSREIQVEDELDALLKVAVYHFCPFGHPGAKRHTWFFRRREDNKTDNFYDYLDKKYPVEPPEQSLQNCKHFLDCMYVVVCGHSLPYPERPCLPPQKLDSIPCASRLQRAGITITDRAPTLKEIKLTGCGYVRNARLSLLKVSVYDLTETILHSLAVHEQLTEGGRLGDLRCFLQCMASLSNDSADLELLLDRGVIDNKVGSNVAGMWNRIMKGVKTAQPSTSWLRCYRDIQSHYHNRVKKWRREVWVLFFSKPWTLVSLLAAVVILLLTGLQTWFTVVNSQSRRWRWPSGG